MATKLGQKNPWCEFIMMMTFMEVKGHQRSNVVIYVLWLPNLVRRFPDASLWWWWPSWRSKVIRGQMQKLCAMATKLSQKKPWCKFMMMTFMKVKGHQRSSEVKCGKLCTMVTKLGQKNRQCKFKMMMTFIEVKGQMGLNIVNYVPGLQTWSEGHWWQLWPALRSKVNRGQMW